MFFIMFLSVDHRTLYNLNV